MRKIYVIDTNILIHAPEAVLNFEDNEVVLPIAVLEELDGLKNSEQEKDRNAREAIRNLERLWEDEKQYSGRITVYADVQESIGNVGDAF